MKIGIITYWNSDNNYGQLLQCYALQHYLRLKGHNVFLIRYTPDKESPSIWDRLIYKISWRKLINKLNGISKRNKLEWKYEKQLHLINIDDDKKRKFDTFRERYIVSSERTYHSLEELKKDPPEADLYITGSDQVWNNSLMEMNTGGYFLNFGKNGVKRISYAASIGRKLTRSELPVFKKYMLQLDGRGVRELSTVDICNQLAVPNAMVVIDPTLLLDKEEYLKLILTQNNEKTEDYIFFYFLNIRSKESIYWNKINRFLKSENLKVKSVCSSGYMEAREIIPENKNIPATMSEWLSLIKDSKYVITTSFHGVIFSILFHKLFLVILLNDAYSEGNGRITSLLKSLNLSDRIFRPNINVKSQIVKAINWDDITIKLENLKSASIEYLKQFTSTDY